ncbi:MAG: DUF5060 domain-containing protein [Planctomycetota bacterium]
MLRRALILPALCGLLLSAPARSAELSGETKLWHRISLDFEGPKTSESATPNPFTDYRLDVTFQNGTSRYVVPGFYAADGDAADTGADAGNIWRVHFRPDAIGQWSWSARFVAGKNVHAGSNGASAGFFDGEKGSFAVSASDKRAPDFRAKGRLDYVGKHHLRFAGSGEYFLKAGADAPENFLAYADFDGDFKSDGHKDQLVKTWAPHVRDWKKGDPTWADGKGKGIIGAVNYLASKGMNVFSFLTLSTEGDDRNVFPHTSYKERERIDCSRMDQWAIVFEHGCSKGMYLHFKTMETENELLLDKGNLGPHRKLYYRELIARFGHNLALNWNLGEEINNATHKQKVAWANYFATTDPYRHHIVIHNMNDPHYDLLGDKSALTGFSLQTNKADFSRVHGRTLDYIRRSVAAGKPWVVACDEPGDAQHSLVTDAEDPTRDNARKNALWGNLMAGGAGVEWYFGYKHPHSDLTCQDYRTREKMWTQSRYALDFFRDYNVPFQDMKNGNERVKGDAYCLYQENKAYVVFLRSGGTASLDLSQAKGTYEIHWFDPRRGGALEVGSAVAVNAGDLASLGSPPRAKNRDWVALIRPGDPNRNYPPSVTITTEREVMLPKGADGASLDLNAELRDDGRPDAKKLTVSWSKLSGPGKVVFGDASSPSTTAAVHGAGRYVLALTASDGSLAGKDQVTIDVLPYSNRVSKVFHAVADAYLEGKKGIDNQVLKVENGRRTAFLKFDVKGLPKDKVTSAVLKLTENGDSGSGRLRFLRGETNDWSAKAVAQAKLKGTDVVGEHQGTVAGGQTIAVDVTPLVSGNGTYTVIVKMDAGGNDVWFGSNESGRKPSLTVTTGGRPAGKKATQKQPKVRKSSTAKTTPRRSKPIDLKSAKPLVPADVLFEERDGLVAVEAEDFFQQTQTAVRAFHRTTTKFTPSIAPDGDPSHAKSASGGSYLEILPDTRRTHDDKLIHGQNFSPKPGKLAVLHYNVHFSTTGRYYVWVRAFSTGSEDNGLHVGIDGKWPESGQRLQWCEGKRTWRWDSKQRTQKVHCGEPGKIYIDVEKPGPHRISFSMREDGFEFDKFLMTIDRNFARPNDAGPKPRRLVRKTK